LCDTGVLEWISYGMHGGGIGPSCIRKGDVVDFACECSGHVHDLKRMRTLTRNARVGYHHESRRVSHKLDSVNDTDFRSRLDNAELKEVPSTFPSSGIFNRDISCRGWQTILHIVDESGSLEFIPNRDRCFANAVHTVRYCSHVHLGIWPSDM
jgi:hypothetical protein